MHKEHLIGAASTGRTNTRTESTMRSSWPDMERMGPRIDPSVLTAFEAQLGTQLPETYRSFLLEINGGSTSRENCVFVSGESTSVLNSLFSLHDTGDVDDDEVSSPLQEYWELSRRWLPLELLNIGYADAERIILVIGGPHCGEVWSINRGLRPEGANPRVEWFNMRGVRKIAPSFDAFLAMLQPLDTRPPLPPPPPGLSEAAKSLLAQFGVGPYSKK